MPVKSGADRRGRRWWSAPLGLLAVAALASLLLLAHLGQWLLVDEPLRQAQAIAVLGGEQAWRSIEAANLYRQGWAHEVWLTRGTPNQMDKEMASIGFAPATENELSRQVLLKLGVPDSAIRVIPQEVNNTLAELHAIAEYARTHRAEPADAPVIIVTSKSHTRRVRVIWNTIQAGRTAIVRYKTSDPFLPAQWWRTTTDALESFREAFGIVNAWAGFPIAPRER